MTDYPLVYRHNGPLKGRRCRIIRYSDVMRDEAGSIVWNAGDHLVAVEFQDGTRQIVERQAIVHATSKPGRAAVATAKMTPAQRLDRKRAAWRNWHARQKETTP